MPELPDVEIFKRYVDSTSLGRRVATMRDLPGFWQTSRKMA
jgi:hypothetical protein